MHERRNRSTRAPCQPPPSAGALPIVLAAIALGTIGACKLVKGVVDAPAEIVQAATGQKPEAPKMDPVVLQAQVMRLADSMAVQITAAAQAFAERAATPAARKQALSWSIEASTRACAIASQPKPFSALVDLIILVAASRSTHERYWGPEVWGEADQPMLAVWTELEAAAWQLAGLALAPEQHKDLHDVLEHWRTEHEGDSSEPPIGLPTFVDLVQRPPGVEQAKKSGLFDLLSVDPLQGLEPAAREVAAARALGERVLFVTGRMPGLLAMQVELLALQLAEQPTPAAVVADFARVSSTAEKIGRVAENLPEVLRVEREAALKQIGDELTAQRAGIVADLEKAREPLVTLLVEARGTLEAGTQLSTALDTTLRSFDELMDRFEKTVVPPVDGVPASGAHTLADAQPAAAEIPARPFDITEYTAAATQLAGAARELGTTIETLDRSLPRVRAVLDETASRADRTVARAIWLALRAVLVAIAAAALAVLLVRWVSARGARRASAL